MRIMHISTRLILGGSQENTILSCIGQSEAGHEVSLVFGPIEGPEGSMRSELDAHPKIEAIETPHLCREIAPVRDLTCRRDLGKIIREWRPDVVHTHSSKAGILGRAAAWDAEVPAVVHTIHGLPTVLHGDDVDAQSAQEMLDQDSVVGTVLGEQHSKSRR